MKGKLKKRIIGSCMFVICMAAILLFAAMPSEASDTTNEGVKLVTIEEYSKDFQNVINDQKTKHYLYAGLYKEGTKENSLTARNVVTKKNISDNGTYVAKFVPEGVMGIRAQVSSSLLSKPNAENSSVRFVTAIDSLLYKEVGFSITRIGDDGKSIELVVPENVTNYVYKELYGVDVTSANPGEPMEYTPKDIHTLAEYFKTYTITGVPKEAYNKELTITPYWITHDDVKVEGTEAIKSVNLGRSWVYINTSVNADEEEFGTYEHPFTNLSDAIGAIVLESRGKIIIQENCEIEVAENFEWKQRGKDFTITGEGTGEENTESLDFSKMIAETSFTDASKETVTGGVLNLGDGVTFTNLNLKMKDIVFAGGNRLEIAQDVTMLNPVTYLFGGSQGESSDKKATVAGTDVTLLSGTYSHIYGGGYNCAVSGSTNVHVGGSANTDEAIDFRNHGKNYTLYGGSFGGVVSKNTTVKIDENVRFNYIYGGGYQSGASVSGIANVTFKGKAMSIFGGSDKTVVGKGTNVIIDGATAEVEQVFGGCESARMTGDTNVHILNGTVYRRVYGGCYNNYEDYEWKSTHGVAGYTSVTFGADTYAKLRMDYDAGSWSSSLTGIDDATYYAVSRLGSNYSHETSGDEIGVFVVNDYNVDANENKDMAGQTDFMESIASSVKPYHYLVKSTDGGAVYSAGDSIRVIPDENMVATVREAADDTVLAYITSDGFYKLPALDETSGQIYVVFTPEKPGDVDVDGYEAKVGGKYFDTLENAISEAMTLSTSGKIGTDNPVVTLLADVTVEDVLKVREGTNITIQSEIGEQYTMTGLDTDKDVLHVQGTLTINNVAIEGGNDGIFVNESGKIYSTEKENTMGVSINGAAKKGLHVTSGTVDMHNVSVSETGEQALHFQNNVKAKVSNFTVASAGSAAVRIMDGADVELQDGTIYAYNYGIAISGKTGTYSKVRVTDTIVERASKNDAYTKNALISVGANSELKLFDTTGEKTVIDGKYVADTHAYEGRGVVVENTGAFIMNGGTIQNNKAYRDDTTNEKGKGNGAGVLVKEGGTFTMHGGNIQNNITETKTVNTAKNGYGAGVYVEGTFTMNKGATISNHGSQNARLNVEGAGVCVNNTGKFVMNGGEIKDNHAMQAGAGVSMLNGTPQFTMKGGSIAGNSTSGNVGGIVLRNGTFTMNEGATISNNTAGAGKLGGGISMNETATFILNGGTFSGNATGNVDNDIHLANGSAHIQVSRQLTHGICVSHHKQAYATNIKIAEKYNDISDEHFQDSMKYIVMQPKGTGEWFVSDTGYLAKTGAILQSNGISTHYATLEGAIDAATDGSTIKICDNATITKTIDKALTLTSDKAVTVIADAGLDGTMFSVIAGKTLSVIGSSAEQRISIVGVSEQYMFESYGDLTLEHVNVADGKIGVLVRKDAGITTLTDVNISNCSNRGIQVQTATDVIANDIHISDIKTQGILIQGAATEEGLTRKFSDFTVENTGSAAIKVESGANVTFEGGTISTTTYGIAVADNNSYAIFDDVTVVRQHFENGKANTSNELVNVAAGTTLELNGTTVIDGKNEVIGLKTSGTVILDGGEFPNCAGSDITFTADGAVMKLAKVLTSNIKIIPKTYATTIKIAEACRNISNEELQNSMKYITVQPNNTGEWFVNSEGYLTKTEAILDPDGAGVHYANLESAIAAAAEGETIKIVENAEITNPITKALTFTSDKAVTIKAADNMKDVMFSVANGKSMNITGAAADKKISIDAGQSGKNAIQSYGTVNLTNVSTSGGQRGLYIGGGTATLTNVSISTCTSEGLRVDAGGVNVTASGLYIDNTGSNGVYLKGASGNKATGTITNFEIKGTKSAAVKVQNSDLELKNGRIETATYSLVTSDASSQLTTEGVTLKTTFDKPFSINGSTPTSYQGVTFE